MPDYRAKYGQLSGNPSIDETIYRCLNDLPEASAHKIAARLTRQQNDPNAAMHTYRELLAGAYLARADYKVAYQHKIAGKTPDWTLLTDANTPSAIIEVATHHLAKAMEDQRRKAAASGDVAVYWPQNEKRLWDRIDTKGGSYAALARDENVPFVVALFANFDAGVDEEELAMSLRGERSVFEDRPDVSGLLFIEDGGTFKGYRFKYYPNPHAARPIHLPSTKWCY